ncbi:NVEALA domain-containing protein [Lactobacillus taiwanensis]
MSDLMLANVEALASGESSGGSCEEVCYPCTNWQCTRILGGVTSVCTQYRKNK